MADAPDTTDVTGGAPVTGGPTTGGPAVAAAASNVAGQQAIAQQLYNPQPAAAPAPAPVPAWNPAMVAPRAQAPTPAAAPEPENRGARIYHGILNALAGTQDTVLVKDPQTGQLTVSQATSTPGSQWKRIIAGALSGLAGASAAGTTGPGGMGRALGGGIQGGMQQARQRQQDLENQAKQQNEEQRENMLANARNAILTQERSAMDFELTRKQADSKYLDNDKMESFIQKIQDDGGQDLGIFPDAASAMAHVNQDPTAVQMLARGRLVTMPVIDENNKYAGLHYAIEPEDYGSQPLDGPMPMPRIMPPTKPGEDYSVKWVTVDPKQPGMNKKTYDTQFSAQVAMIEKLDHNRMTNAESMTKTQDMEGPDGKTHTYGWNPQTQMFDRDQGLTKKAPSTAVINTGEKYADVDRLGGRLAKPYEKGQEAASSQIEKIDDAANMIGGNAEAQALGIPKVLTALVSGAGTGVRITQPELNAIAKARGIQGNFEGWLNSISGQGKLSATQKVQLLGVLKEAKARLRLKLQIQSDALDAINGAETREDIMAADKEARRKMLQLDNGGTLTQPAAAPAAKPGPAPTNMPATLPAAATGGAGFDFSKHPVVQTQGGNQ